MSMEFLPLSPRRSSARNVPSGEERGETDVFAGYQCGPGSNPSFDAICGLSLLLVLSFAPRGFSPGTPVFQIQIRPGIR